MAALTGRLRAGTLTVPEWQAQMAGEVKTLHVAMATAAKGGKAQMSPADYGRVGAEVKRQYQYLARFAEDVASGKQPLDGRAENRARLYGAQGSQFYGESVRQLWADKGETRERWVRRATESCPGCVEQSARGWVGEGVLPRLGSQACKARCKCSIQSRLVRQEQEAA